MTRTLFPMALSAFLVLGAAHGAVAAGDAAPSAGEVLRSMKTAVEPPRASLRGVTMTLSADGATRRWSALQARSPKADGTRRMVMVMQSPAEVRGTAIMIEEQKKGPNVEWRWVPAVGRVRKVVPSLGFESFLGTDFTYADLGFVPIDGRRLGPVEATRHGDVDAYLVREDIEDSPWFYSRIDTTVARDTMLPLQRLFYDVAGRAWKKEVFEKAEVIEGVPTPLTVRMLDLQAGSSTELVYDHVDYRDELPEDLFDPTALPRLLDHSVWNDRKP